jgi:hypothetical protein
MILNFEQFELFVLIESLLNNFLNEQTITFSEDVKEIFNKIQNENQIALFLLNQLSAKGEMEIDGEIKNVEEVFVHPKKSDFFEIHYTKPNGSKAKQEMKIGKFITALLDQIKNNKIHIKPNDIEAFVKKVYAYRESGGQVDTDYEYALVDGKDINKYYLESNSECLSGGLGGSCMRYEEKNKFVNVYANEFKQFVKLLVKRNKTTDKIVARALLWKTDQGMYLDRIYASDDKIIEEMMEYAKKAYKIQEAYDMKKIKKDFTITSKMNSEFEPKYMPYLDTFNRAIYNTDKKEFILCTDDTLDKIIGNIDPNIEYFKYKFGSTNGEYTKNKSSYFIEKYYWLRKAKYSRDSVFAEEDDELIFKSGTWIDGYWREGIWEDSVWENGTWRSGIWKNGEWKNGEWQYGEWRNGKWKIGVWKNGTFKNGTWENGTWEKGAWENGIWKNGIWENGVWDKGTWENGTWKRGTWKDGVWNKGTWKNGIWENGTWKGGTWENGTWEDGIWEDGEWKGGTWKKGTWKNGKGKPKNA